MTETRDGGRERYGPHFVQSVARALSVMRTFSAERPYLTLSEAAQETGLDRATARRLLLTLADLGYVRTDGRTPSNSATRTCPASACRRSRARTCRSWPAR
jgi:IclR family pca regulon transcriptional regulator